MKGIDISQYQTTTPSLTGLGFIVLRATIGTTVDTMYAKHYAAARKAGLVVMAYHFNWKEASIPAQVAKFMDVAKDADFLWLDQEGDHGFSDAQAQEFINRVRTLGKACGLYHSASGFSGVDADAKWVADWRSAASTAGHPLNAAGTAEFAGWDLWQYAGSPLDQDLINPAVGLAGLLRRKYQTQATYDAAMKVAADQLANQKAGYDAMLADNMAQIATLKTDLAAALLKESNAELELAAFRSQQADDRAAAKRLLGL